MQEYAELANHIKQVSEEIIRKKQYDLVDLIVCREQGRLTVRFLVDRQGGITLAECTLLNKELSNLLDTCDFIQGRYVLEVCSPGLDRNLVKEDDFIRMLNKKLKVVTREPFDHSHVNNGVLKQIENNHIYIETESGKVLVIPIVTIKKAQEEIQW